MFPGMHLNEAYVYRFDVLLGVLSAVLVEHCCSMLTHNSSMIFIFNIVTSWALN